MFSVKFTFLDKTVYFLFQVFILALTASLTQTVTGDQVSRGLPLRQGPPALPLPHLGPTPVPLASPAPIFSPSPAPFLPPTPVPQV